eukprot:350027-Chlamydomonas_euryale.AAC.8
MYGRRNPGGTVMGRDSRWNGRTADGTGQQMGRDSRWDGGTADGTGQQMEHRTGSSADGATQGQLKAVPSWEAQLWVCVHTGCVQPYYHYYYSYYSYSYSFFYSYSYSYSYYPGKLTPARYKWLHAIAVRVSDPRCNSSKDAAPAHTQARTHMVAGESGEPSVCKEAHHGPCAGRQVQRKDGVDAHGRLVGPVGKNGAVLLRRPRRQLAEEQRHALGAAAVAREREVPSGRVYERCKQVEHDGGVVGQVGAPVAARP